MASVVSLQNTDVEDIPRYVKDTRESYYNLLFHKQRIIIKLEIKKYR